MKIFKRVLAAAGATALLAAVVLLVFLLRKREAVHGSVMAMARSFIVKSS